MASSSAVEIDGTDSSYLDDDSLVVDYNNALNAVDSVVDSDNLDVDDSGIGSKNRDADIVSKPESLKFHQLQSIINSASSSYPLELQNDFINDDGSVIIIDKDLTIDGNGHTIDLNQHAGFKSSRGNVYLKNLIMKNGNFVFAGAIFISSNASYIIDNCTFVNNSADFGAAINSLSRNSLFIRNSIFDSNSVSKSAGAVYSYGNIFLENSLFLSNKAMKSGGAIYTHKEANIDKCTFRDNSASNEGGAVFAENVTMKKSPSYFINNSADAAGGAIYANKFNTDVYYASFINNHAGNGYFNYDGGAVYIFKRNYVTFENCIFIANSCTDEGGAIYLDSKDSHLSLKNNIFMGNSAGYEGQSSYNCGYYDVIENNFWGFDNPSSDNDQVIEWKATILQKNVHHSDSNPLIIAFDLDKNNVSVNETITASLYFNNSDGSKFLGKIYGLDDVYFNINENLKEITKNMDDNSITIEYQPQMAAKYIIFPHLHDHALAQQRVKVD